MTEQFRRREGLGYRVVATVDTGVAGERDGQEDHDGIVRAVERELASQSIDEVFVSLPLLRTRGVIEGLVSLCEQEGVTVRLLPRLAELKWSWASLDTVLGQPVITISSIRPQEAAMLVKRALDVVVSATMLVVFAPLFVLIAIAIKLDSRGPVIFAQERVGYNRRRFYALKFRTMVIDAQERQGEVEHLNEAEGPVFKIKYDPRITHVGRFLRSTSLDELPQFLNVLQGDMSLVGPRPLPVRDFQRIEVRWHRRRFSVKPGLTCLWQVAAREPKFSEWVRMDMEYIDNWSLRLDLEILAKTIPAVLSRHGAH
jgi:exopolysaccharide biosynthesis polyprenyl glycosylphosphotransferase